MKQLKLTCGFYSCNDCERTNFGEFILEDCEFMKEIKPEFKPIPHQVLIGLKDDPEYKWIKKDVRYTVMLVGEMYLRFENQLNFPLDGIENVFKPATSYPCGGVAIPNCDCCSLDGQNHAGEKCPYSNAYKYKCPLCGKILYDEIYAPHFYCSRCKVDVEGVKI